MSSRARPARRWRTSSASGSASSRRRRPTQTEEELERLSRNRNVLAAVIEAALGAVFLQHGFAAIEDAVVDAFADQIEHALTLARRPQDGPAGAARPHRPSGGLRGDLRRRAAARAPLHVRRGHRRRGARSRRGADEEGGRAGGGRARRSPSSTRQTASSTVAHMPDFAELKQMQSAVWSAGAFEDVAESIHDMHVALVEALDPQPDDRWLDVGSGAGNLAELAAGAGARVTGIDLSPRLVEVAKARAEAGGYDIEYRVGDAEKSRRRGRELRQGDLVRRDDLRSRPRRRGPRARARDPARRAPRLLGLDAGGHGRARCSRCSAPSSRRFRPVPARRSRGDRSSYVHDKLGEAFELSIERRISHFEDESPEHAWEYFAPRFGPVKMMLENLRSRASGRVRKHGARTLRDGAAARRELRRRSRVPARHGHAPLASQRVLPEARPFLASCPPHGRAAPNELRAAPAAAHRGGARFRASRDPRDLRGGRAGRRGRSARARRRAARPQQ